MMSPDRRGLTLKLAASILRPKTKDDPRPTAADVVRYAKTLDDYMYHGIVPEEKKP